MGTVLNFDGTGHLTDHRGKVARQVGGVFTLCFL